jgi:dynein heavy chain 1
MIVVRVLRPDRFTMSARGWIDVVFQGDINLSSGLEFNLNEVIDHESKATSPIMLCSRPGFDASAKIDALAHARSHARSHATGHTTGHATGLATGHKGFKYQSLAMGSAEGYQLAEKYIANASKNGTWVLLRNVHLCPSYMVQLEKKLHSFASHDQFRLFLTAEINPKLPTSLLRMSQTFVYEPPAGIKASLTRSLAGMPAARMNRAPAERSRLYFLLAWFHATVIERLQYVPIGWSKMYEFSETDLQCALTSFDGWIDGIAKGRAHVDPDEIPWEALHAMLGKMVVGVVGGLLFVVDVCADAFVVGCCWLLLVVVVVLFLHTSPPHTSPPPTPFPPHRPILVRWSGGQ